MPDEATSAPSVAVARLAERLRVDPAMLEGYGDRAHTRSDHLRLAAGYLGWKAPAESTAMKELEQFLLRAMEHDSPTLLFNLATEYLMAAKTIRPGVTTLAKMVATARTSATALTWEKVAHLLTDLVRAEPSPQVDTGLSPLEHGLALRPCGQLGEIVLQCVPDRTRAARSTCAPTRHLAATAASSGTRSARAVGRAAAVSMRSGPAASKRARSRRSVV